MSVTTVNQPAHPTDAATWQKTPFSLLPAPVRKTRHDAIQEYAQVEAFEADPESMHTNFVSIVGMLGLNYDAIAEEATASVPESDTDESVTEDACRSKRVW